jgi:hypothetical protein
MAASLVHRRITRRRAAIGFGHRLAFDRFGLDISFFNGQFGDAGSYYTSSGSTMSLVKLQGLYFTNQAGNSSAYFGGGLSYGRTEIRMSDTGDFPKSGRGAGLQGELTVGYEIARVTSARVFAEAAVTLPFYGVEFETFSFPPLPSDGRYTAPTVTIERDHVPSLAFSVGLGWQRRGR